MDSWIGRLGVRFLQVSPSSFCHFVPFTLWTIFTDRRPLFSLNQDREKTCPAPNLLACRETSRSFDSHSFFFIVSLHPHEMSLNIDINMILPVKFSGVSSDLNSKLLTSSLSCNVLYPGKIFHSNSIGSPSILSKFLYSRDVWNHSNLCSHAVFDWGFSCIFPTHNTESENT